jgi:hypothetical protein
MAIVVSLPRHIAQLLDAPDSSRFTSVAVGD